MWAIIKQINNHHIILIFTPMNLTIDIGNSRTKLGIFNGQQLIERPVLKVVSVAEIETIINAYHIDKAILSTVASYPPKLDIFLQKKLFYLKLEKDTPLPIRNAYKTPETLGKDRIAAAAGAWQLFPNQHSLVIDAGTCITVDFVHQDGVYMGGTITPGISLRYKAMHQFTSKLPMVKRQRLEGFIGYSTETCMRVGAQMGTVLEIDGFISRYKAEFGEINVIMTGGDANYFVTELKSEIFARPNLVLTGLNEILAYNFNDA